MVSDIHQSNYGASIVPIFTGLVCLLLGIIGTMFFVQNPQLLALNIKPQQNDVASITSNYTNDHVVYQRVQFFTDHIGGGDADKIIAQFDGIIAVTQNDLAQINDQLGQAYHQKGIVHLSKQEHKKAKAAFLKAMPLTIEARGQNHHEVGLLLHNTALAYWGLKNYRSADFAFDKAIENYKKNYAAHHSSIKQLNESKKKMEISRQYVANDSLGNTDELERLLRKL